MTEKEKEDHKLWLKGITVEPKDFEEDFETTCCGDLITGTVEDAGLCPTCLEHI